MLLKKLLTFLKQLGILIFSKLKNRPRYDKGGNLILNTKDSVIGLKKTQD